MPKKAKSSVQAPIKKKRKGHPQKNPKSLKNLVQPWPKGVSGNPSGLPGTDVPALIARRAFEADPEGVIEALRDKLKAGDIQTFKELGDRGYGKVKDRTQFELTGKDGEPLEITVKLVRPQLKDMA